jgi:hypothetical protein
MQVLGEQLIAAVRFIKALGGGWGDRKNIATN